MESSGRQDGPSLSNLIHELSDFLQAQSEESTTTTPHSGSSTLAPRMRTVLLALLSECLEFKIGTDRHVSAVILAVGSVSDMWFRERTGTGHRAEVGDPSCATVPVHGVW